MTLKKILIVSTATCLGTTVCIGGITWPLLKNKWQTHNAYKSRIERRLEELENKRQRLVNMEKALLICFQQLSEYEAHYYAILYDDFATKYNVPWEIYPAIIRIESNFDPTVLSPKHAKGIAQVLENTGKDVAKRLNISYKDGGTLWNDLLCQIIGFTYLSEAIQQKGLEDGVKAYAGGLGFDAGRKDIGQYRTTVHEEYERLRYVYKGVISEAK